MNHFSEKLVILILFLIQFIDVLDFMIVMPLGPDFTKDLGISSANLGWLASSYTIAAAISGILSSTIIDRFERKKVLIVALLGLTIANIFSSFAWNIHTMLASRFLAGIFGGPATSICFAVVSDLFAENRRGEVMGKVMSGFSLAAIFGVPIGLEISTHFGWHMSFYMVALLCIIAVILIVGFMPQINIHKSSAKEDKVTYLSLFGNSKYLLVFLATCFGSMAAFMIIPYISPFIQANMNFPRDDVGQIYFLGGLGSFFAMHLAGKFIDKTSSFLTTTLANIFILFTLVLGMIFKVDYIPILLLFSPFMIGMAVRNVSNYTLFSKVPSSNDRAGFMSIISCVQHIASSLGAVLTSMILVTENNGHLTNMGIVALIALILFLGAPLLLNKVEKKIILANLKKNS